MIGLVIVTHGNLAIELKSAMEHVVGAQENLATICIGPDDDMELRLTDIETAVNDVNQNDGVIILTDLFGGTPSNLSISLMKPDEIEVIAGINLPMLVKLAGLRNNASLSDAAQQAQETGRKYIHVASQVLQGEV